ncbi:MAG: tRNA pseudouridine(65) synthase TruC [Gammaproteobacteria bacterium]
MLNILYRDDQLIAIDKPAGLLVHRSLIDRHETRFAVQLLRDQIGRRVYPVHRLDKPTSGVLLFALSEDAARRMGATFETDAVRKTYLAVVRGYTEEHGHIDYPLREERDRMTDALADPDKPAQPAITDYRRLATLELPVTDGRHPTSRYSLLAVAPRTGRRHQIRRHMKHLFHPVIGDTTHGDGRHNRIFREHLHCRRLLLTALELRFPHPGSGMELRIRAPLDAEFARIAALFGWDAARDDVQIAG